MLALTHNTEASLAIIFLIVVLAWALKQILP